MIRPPRVPRALFEWLTLPRSLAIIVVVLGGFGYYAWAAYRRGGSDATTSVVSLGVLVAFLVAAPLIAFVTGYFRWVDERTWMPWHGRYHAFDDCQIRVTEARETLWFSSADIHAALDLPSRPARLKSLRVTEYRRDDELGDVLSNAGLKALFGTSTARQTLRLLAWADRDVRKPWQNRRDDVKAGYKMGAAMPPPATTAANPPAPPATAVPSRARPIDR